MLRDGHGAIAREFTPYGLRWIVDARRDDGRRYIVRSDELRFHFRLSVLPNIARDLYRRAHRRDRDSRVVLISDIAPDSFWQRRDWGPQLDC